MIRQMCHTALHVRNSSPIINAVRGIEKWKSAALKNNPENKEDQEVNIFFVRACAKVEPNFFRLFSFFFFFAFAFFCCFCLFAAAVYWNFSQFNNFRESILQTM